MSRSYEMTVVITGFNSDKVESVVGACKDEWDFDADDVDDSLAFDVETVQMTGVSQLCGGETFDEFAVRLRDAVFKANGAGCSVEVRGVNLDDQPYESSVFTKDDYTPPKKKRKAKR